MPVALRPHDLVRLSAIAAGTESYPCDMAEDHAWLWRAYRGAAGNRSMLVEASLTGGVTWVGGVVAAEAETDADGSGSVPSLAVGPHGTVFLAYHVTGGTSRIYRTDDSGRTWSLHESIASLRYPRLLIGVTNVLLAAHNGTQLLFYRTNDWWDTRSALAGLSITAPAQRCALIEDHSGIVHVVYTDAGGSLQHRYTADLLTWSSTTNLGTGTRRAFAVYHVSGFLAYYSGSTLTAIGVKNDGKTSDGAIAVPSGTWQPGDLGSLIDRHGLFWITGSIDDVVVSRYSKNAGAAWATPS